MLDPLGNDKRRSIQHLLDRERREHRLNILLVAVAMLLAFFFVWLTVRRYFPAVPPQRTAPEIVDKVGITWGQNGYGMWTDC